MSVQKFYQQVWPELLSQTDPTYIPRPQDLFAVVKLKRITEEKEEINLDEVYQQNTSPNMESAHQQEHCQINSEQQ